MHWRTLDRYLVGECTPGEAAAVERWCAADPRRRSALDALRGGPRARWDTAAAWARLAPLLTDEPSRATPHVPARAPSHAIGRADAPAPSPGAPTHPAPLAAYARRGARRIALRHAAPRGRYPGAWLAAAAALALAAGAVVARGGMLHPTWRAEPPRTLSAARGERLQIGLADGTRVLLGAGSQLEAPERFGPGPRTVRLVGEGYFQVAPDAARPFRVRAANAVAQVLGTEFTVRAFPGGDVRVVVASGTVALAPATGSTAPISTAAPALLTRGMLGRVAPDGTLSMRRNVPLATYLGWTEGRRSYDRAPLRDVAADLARWYDLDVRVRDSALAARRVTAIITDDQPASEVLAALALALDARVERVGRTVTFYTNPETQ